MKPPPRTIAASMDSPIPCGGLKSRSRPAGPRLPPSSNESRARVPSRSTASADRPEPRLKRPGQLEREAAVGGGEADVELLDLERAEVEVHREVGLETRPALQVESGGLRPADEQVDLDLERPARQDRGEEAVGALQAQNHPSTLDRGLDRERALGPPGQHVPGQVGSRGGAHPPALHARAAGRSQHHHRRRPRRRRGLEAGPYASGNFGGQRPDLKIGRRQQHRPSAQLERGVRGGGQGGGLSQRKDQVEVRLGLHPQHGLYSGYRVVGEPDVDGRDTQKRRRPGLNEREVGDPAEEGRQPSQQQVPFELGASPPVQLGQHRDRVVDQAR